MTPLPEDANPSLTSGPVHIANHPPQSRWVAFAWGAFAVVLMHVYFVLLSLLSFVAMSQFESPMRELLTAGFVFLVPTLTMVGLIYTPTTRRARFAGVMFVPLAWLWLLLLQGFEAVPMTIVLAIGGP